MGPGGFGFTIPGCSGGHERTEQFGGHLCDFFDRSLESLSVRSGRFGKPADLPHELQRRCSDLLFRRRRCEVVQYPDISAHVVYLCNRLSSNRKGGVEKDTIFSQFKKRIQECQQAWFIVIMMEIRRELPGFDLSLSRLNSAMAFSNIRTNPKTTVTVWE